MLTQNGPGYGGFFGCRSSIDALRISTNCGVVKCFGVVVMSGRKESPHKTPHVGGKVRIEE